MQLTRFTDYGLRSLIYLAARPDALCNSKDISDYYRISHNHVVKVIHRLATLGYVESVKGKGGGIRIAKEAGDLFLGDVIQQLEPNMDLLECFDAEKNTCRITENCRLKHTIYEARQAFIDSLNQYQLKDILTFADQKPFF
jgi:Rrf2 family nitric oxide-sensitive transcriptional repressor